MKYVFYYRLRKESLNILEALHTMSKKTVVAAISLISVGIVFGAIIVSSFSGVNLSLAGNPGITYNTTPPYKPSNEVYNLNQTFIQVSKAVTPTVVSITVTVKADNNPHNFFPFFRPDDQGERFEHGSGSGIVLTSDGYILTNNHVIKGVKEDGIQVTMYDGREFKAKLIGIDPATDVGVIKINAKDIVPASIGNSDNVEVGSWVLAVGNPLGLNSTVTAGIVSALSRNINIMRDNLGRRNNYGIENFIQTDAAINPGNSGGALVDLNGRVVGMNTAIASTNSMYQGYGFAIPINLAKVVADAIIKEGKFVRGYIGVSIKSIDDKTARALRLDKPTGVFVSEVKKGSAGEEAGIRDGDIILSVDGKEVKYSNQLQSMIGQHRPGDVVTLSIYRNEKIMDVRVKLKGLDESDTQTSNDRSDRSDSEESTTDSSPMTFDKLGFSVRPLDKTTKSNLGVESGVLVSSVNQSGQAAENNLQRGMVIFEARVGSKVKKIKTVSDLKSFISEQNPGNPFLLRVIRSAQGDTEFIPLEILE